MWTSRSQLPTCSPPWWKRRSRWASWCGLLQFAEGQAGLSRLPWQRTRQLARRALSELELPRDATVVAVLRAARVIVPRGDTVLETGDEVIALVTDPAEEELRTALVGRADEEDEPE